MKKKQHSPEQIVRLLERGDGLIASGNTVDQAARELGISPATWYAWKKQYGTMTVEQLSELKDLKKENAELKRLLAEAELAKAILKRVAAVETGFPRATAHGRCHGRCGVRGITTTCVSHDWHVTEHHQDLTARVERRSSAQMAA